MPVRLKSLELNGYKTFANRTEFEFAEAVTAIVGPNGSGKSNIADALRWVLGEQSYSLLRGRKTIDMIFSGSEQRPRSGMASATIVFDNSDEWLPIDFSEVSITRRAYRDGENEYLINGQRVRLKDVSELLARSGLAERNYTIIGQGLVDAALSLRADERRRLFEEAAGIGLYRLRREEAIRRLEVTRRNLERVEDILAELRPRLRSLERQASRAREYDQIKADLRVALLEWYGYHWHRAQQELIQAQGVTSQQEATLEAARKEQSRVDVKLAEYRDRLHDLREQLNTKHRELALLHSRKEAIGRQLAVLEERERSLVERFENLTNELARLKEELAFEEDRLQKLNSEAESRQSEYEEARAQVEIFRQAFQAELDLQNQIESALQRAQKEQVELAATRAELLARKAEIEARQERLAALLAPSNQAVEESHQAALHAGVVAGDLDAELQQAREIHQDDIRRLEAARRTLTEVEDARRAASEKLYENQADIARLRAQQDVLHQAEKALIGYSTGARLFLEAARRGELSGFLGVLGDQLEVPAELETAISAALGDFVDTVLLDSLDMVDQALDRIQGEEARAVLLAISQLGTIQPLTPPDDSGCLGRGDLLVEAPPRLRPVVELLLGRVLVVGDRGVARRLLPGLPVGARVVTLGGEVFHVEGPIKAGLGGEGIALGRARQHRQIADSISVAQLALEVSQANLKELEERLESLQAEYQQNEAAVQQAGARANQLGNAFQEAYAEVESIRRKLDWEENQRDSLVLQIDQTNSEAAEISNKLTRNAEESDQLGETIRTLTEQLAALELSEAQTQLSHWELQAAIAEQAVTDTLSRRGDQHRLVVRLQERLADLEIQLHSVNGEIEQSAVERARLLSEEKGTAEQVEQIAGQVGPEEAELTALETGHEAFLTEELQSRRALSQAERYSAQAQITLARKVEALESLQRRIEDDFGLVAFEYEEEISGATPLPFTGLVEELPRIETLPPDLEDALRRKRAQLRRMGPVNPEAQTEYQEVKERFEFLTSQITDLRRAERDVQQVIAELEELMEREFQKTFEAVASEFRETFGRLFGGGSARLRLTDPDSLTETGIDIEARLPGRREQGLSLLSGGERSLTAVALIFALLKVSPTPFCVLDEVDAMLDEVNVGRFRELLRELGEDTQFVLITHNRNTVQVADVIYGVTMGRDSASQVLSLKLDQVEGVYVT